MVEGSALEKRCPRKGTLGSNPSLSVRSEFSRLSVILEGGTPLTTDKREAGKSHPLRFFLLRYVTDCNIVELQMS